MFSFSQLLLECAMYDLLMQYKQSVKDKVILKMFIFYD